METISISTETEEELLEQIERDILSSQRVPRTAVRHSQARISLIDNQNVIPKINARIASLMPRATNDSMRICEGLAALRKWIMMRCEIPRGNGNVGTPPPRYHSLSAPVCSMEAHTSLAMTEELEELEMMVFSGTPQRARQICEEMASRGMSARELFVLRRYLGLTAADRDMTDEEYFFILAGIAKRLPADAK